MPLSAALPGEQIQLAARFGWLNLYVHGSGRPLLLIHSINAAASAAEVRPLYIHYASTRRVYALELPGFGFSERRDRAYTPRLMCDAIHDAVRFIRIREAVTTVDALAVSLGCEFLARAVMEDPGSYRSVALVSPTGFSGRSRRNVDFAPRGHRWWVPALRRLGWRRILFPALTLPRVIRYFLVRTFGSPRIDEELWAYAVQTAHQPGAQHAPLYFLAGCLFSGDILSVYETLGVPVWLSHGTRGDFTDYRALQSAKVRTLWKVSVFATGPLPYFEELADFCSDYDQFLARPVNRLAKCPPRSTRRI